MNDDSDSLLENADQVAYWNSENGRKWALHQEGLDAIASKVKEHLLKRAQLVRNESIIDIGCGTGDTTIEAATAVGPTGTVLGVDVSSLLLDSARQRAKAKQLSNIAYVLADAQTHRFEAGAGDAVISRFGMMFFSDPIKAFANIANALKHNGRIVFVTWGSLEDNPWFAVPRRAAIKQLGEPTPDDPYVPGPLAFQDRDYVTEILKSAGYSDVSAEEIDVPLPFFGSLEQTAALASNVGPAARIVRQLGGDIADLTAITEAIEGAFSEYAKSPKPSVPSKLNFFAAKKP